MKHHRHISLASVLFASLMLFFSCQDADEADIISQEDQKDQAIMDKALMEAEEYVDELEANVPEESRSKWKRPDIACIVYKFQNGNGPNGNKLLYKTWDGERKGYYEVTEEEVTAIVKPNTIICHFRGGALSALNAIEFDEPSRAIIGEGNNFEYVRNYWWVTYIPASAPVDAQLKYDIVYDVRNDGEGPIRLDPKIDVVDRAED